MIIGSRLERHGRCHILAIRTIVIDVRIIMNFWTHAYSKVASIRKKWNGLDNYSLSSFTQQDFQVFWELGENGTTVSGWEK